MLSSGVAETQESSNFKDESQACGTEQKCPCRKWVNCSKYVDQKAQAVRIKQKEKEPELEDNYDRFGVLERMPDIVPVAG